MTIHNGRPDVGAVTADYLHTLMLAHLRKAERAEAAWLERDAANLARHRRKSRSDQEARINAAIDQPGDPLLRLHGWLLTHHRDWARTYAAVLQGMAARAQLTQDRPVPPDGRRPAPGSAAAVDGPAAGESPDGGASPFGAGVSSGPRPRRAQREPDGRRGR